MRKRERQEEMSTLKFFDSRTKTKWIGMWYHPKFHMYTSYALSLADIRKFKGNVRLKMVKNKLHTKGDNRPTYDIQLISADCPDPLHLDVEHEDTDDVLSKVRSFLEYYFDPNEIPGILLDLADEYNGPLYTRDDAIRIIRKTAEEIRQGVDEYDILPEDFI